MKRPQQRQRAGKEHPCGPVGPLRAADDRAAEGVHILPLLVVYGKERGIELHGLNGGRRDKEHRAEEEAEQRAVKGAVARHRHKEARGGKRERDTAARAEARKARREQVLFLLLSLWRGLRALLLPRRGTFAAQQLVAGHTEHLRDDRNKRKIRRTVVALPAGDGLVRHVQPFRAARKLPIVFFSIKATSFWSLDGSILPPRQRECHPTERDCLSPCENFTPPRPISAAPSRRAAVRTPR